MNTCGVCGAPADVIAAVPMCGVVARYPMCMDCFVPVQEAGYCEDVEMLPDPARFEPTEQTAGRALLRRRYSDGWEDIDLTGADIHIIHTQVTPDTGPWTLLITLADGTDFLHGEWGSRRTAKDKSFELRKIGRAGR